MKKILALMVVCGFLSACTTMGSLNSNPVFDPETNNKVYFDFDKAEISPEARALLDSEIAWLKNNPTKNATIEGHCDERGTREYNLGLGSRRATTVKNYLVAGGISAKRIKTVSYGKERPEVAESNEDAWAQNRRSVTTLVQ